MILDEILAHKRAEVAERRAHRPYVDVDTAYDTVDTGYIKADIGSVNAAIGSIKTDIAYVTVDTGSIKTDIAYVTVDTGSDKTDIGSVKADRASRPHGFAAALRQPGVSVIAEFKRRSPSGGDLRPDSSVSEIVRSYAANGAAAVSILTDSQYFGGSDSDLTEARSAAALPALRKDFVVDPYQIYEARALGADAVLLIVRALSDAELASLLALTAELRMDALVETHSADEVRRALHAGATLIGVNNRDLDTLQTDVSLAPRLRPLVPSSCVFVAESGVSSPSQIAALSEAGADAVLIGESLLRAPDPGRLLGELVAAAAPRGVRA